MSNTDHLESELRDFWCAYEASIGFRSTFSAMLAAHAGVAMGAGPPSNWDPYADVVDRISEGSRVYRTLGRLPTATVVVLYKLHGPRKPADDHAAFGDLSPLASLTQAAETAREEMVLRESTRLSDVVGERVQQDVRRARNELADMFWTEVVAMQAAASRVNRRRMRSPEESSRATQLDEQRIAAGRELLGRILDAYGCDGVIRARIGAIESTDRRLTADEAIRARIKAKDVVFIAEVSSEARRIQKAAYEAYTSARKEEIRATAAARRARIKRAAGEDALLGAA